MVDITISNGKIKGTYIKIRLTKERQTVTLKIDINKIDNCETQNI